nr:uncharacterized protein CI109_006279 [Kwoniella shandongensis]KAA5525380.1 hypothetical protein CI109_006279 [Kwoniella shandongensis]
MAVAAQASRMEGTPADPSPRILPADIPRRPSPWHDIAHSLSTTSLPPSTSKARRDSSSSPTIDCPTPPSDGLSASASQALREWEERLSHPLSDVTRHQLVPLLHPHQRRAETPTKLAAERDKVGYIEYKLKLIEPTQERFEKLVTQMMWRLKQGKNEAIYELGLADDGTVIGLSRAEMDASLRTLELMASEVGGTVIVLKEIVLNNRILPAPISPLASSSFSSSFTSLTSSCDDGKLSGKSSEADLKGRTRKSRRKPRVKKKPSSAWDDGEHLVSASQSKLVLFNKEQLENPEDSSNSPTPPEVPVENTDVVSNGEDEHDITPFQFDMDDISPKRYPHYKKRFEQPTPPRGDGIPSAARKKDDKKRRKSLARQEQRRMDLLRGDGTNPMWAELTSGLTPETKDHDASHPNALLPHQPVRPSSLRLATPVDQPADSFIDDLLHVPLDSLSLSFADVRTVSGEANRDDEEDDDASSCSSLVQTEDAPPLDLVNEALEESRLSLQGEELICVEALVVRKIQHDHEGEGEEEEEWGFGGEEDVWGFGAEED